jgi:hypothetical protein
MLEGRRRPTIEAIRSFPIHQISEIELGSKMLTTTRGFRSEEGVDKPLPVAAATTVVVATNLTDLADEEAPTMSADLEGWRSSKREKQGIWIWWRECRP